MESFEPPTEMGLSPQTTFLRILAKGGQKMEYTIINWLHRV